MEGEPGPHVRAAVASVEAAGLAVDFGPFGTTVRGDEAAVLGVVDRLVRAAIGAGATRVSLQVARP